MKNLFGQILLKKNFKFYMLVFYLEVLLLFYKYMHKKISPLLHAAIIFSLEGVFATIAAWILLNQVLDINNLFGCVFILFGVLFSQLVPIFKKN